MNLLQRCPRTIGSGLMGCPGTLVPWTLEPCSRDIQSMVYPNLTWNWNWVVHVFFQWLGRIKKGFHWRLERRWRNQRVSVFNITSLQSQVKLNNHWYCSRFDIEFQFHEVGKVCIEELLSWILKTMIKRLIDSESEVAHHSYNLSQNLSVDHQYLLVKVTDVWISQKYGFAYVEMEDQK